MRQPDLVIPYVHQPDSEGAAIFGMSAKILPMVAMFMRSKVLAWSGFFIALQTYLSEPESASQDSFGIGGVFTAIMSLFVAYMDFVMPGQRAAAPQAA